MLFDSVGWSKVTKSNISYDFDIVLFWLALGLLGLGVVMVYFKQGSLPRTTKLRRYRACFVSKKNVMLRLQITLRR